jgi:serine/threonine protein kinase/beta-lactam-binding protein with PASTA domain
MAVMNKTILNNRYEIIRPVGSGGMAEVFLAHDNLLDRNVAVKMLRDQFLADKELLEQFRREAKSAARLIHPYIINIYDVVSEGDIQYIIMEYVDGVTLKEYLKEHKLPLNAVLEIAVRLADALQHAHSRNIIHCDIKPQNILIDKYLNPKITDFGIAKMISNQTTVYTAAVMGSVHYISPEQAVGGKITASSDVYSLGVVLFEMLTGQVPFTGNTAVSVAMMHAEKPVPSLSDFMDEVPEGLQHIIDRALAKKTEDRYQNADELRRDLLDLKMKLYPFSSDEYKKDMQAVVTESSYSAAKETAEDDYGATMIMKPVRSIGSEFETEVQEETRQELPEQEADDMPLNRAKKTKKKWNFTKILVYMTVAVVALSVIAHFIFNRNREVLPVPDVVNMTVVEAQAALEEKGFEVELEERYGNAVKPGTVMEQSPKAGEKRKQGSTIYLTISKGAELKTVPEIIGMSLSKAENLLKDEGYAIGKITKKFDSSKTVGIVLEQFPKAMDKAPKGSKINLVVNEGEKTVPNVVGQKLATAKQLLEKEGLVVGSTSYTKNQADKDTVLSTDPVPGSHLSEGAKVNLTLSSGGSDSMDSVYVDFVVPGTQEQHVQIYVTDSRGRRLIYDGSQKGGVRLRQKISASDNAKVQLYCDNKLIEEKTL